MLKSISYEIFTLGTHSRILGAIAWLFISIALATALILLFPEDPIEIKVSVTTCDSGECVVSERELKVLKGCRENETLGWDEYWDDWVCKYLLVER